MKIDTLSNKGNPEQIDAVLIANECKTQEELDDLTRWVLGVLSLTAHENGLTPPTLMAK